jgi:hypothetical protein
MKIQSLIKLSIALSVVVSGISKQSLAEPAGSSVPVMKSPLVKAGGSDRGGGCLGAGCPPTAYAQKAVGAGPKLWALSCMPTNLKTEVNKEDLESGLPYIVIQTAALPSYMKFARIRLTDTSGWRVSDESNRSYGRGDISPWIDLTKEGCQTLKTDGSDYTCDFTDEVGDWIFQYTVRFPQDSTILESEILVQKFVEKEFKKQPNPQPKFEARVPMVCTRVFSVIK